MNEKMADQFPLTWPIGCPRSTHRRRSQFGKSFEQSRKDLYRELKLMGINDWNVIMSTNLPLRRDGFPYAQMSLNGGDPGVAVYFRKKDDKPMVFACDKWDKVEDNLRAIVMTIKAVRGIERWGSSDMMERAFTGFQALPPARSTSWWDVLKIPRNSTLEQAKAAYRNLARQAHPDMQDKTSMTDEMYQINKAWAEAEKELLR